MDKTQKLQKLENKLLAGGELTLEEGLFIDEVESSIAQFKELSKDKAKITNIKNNLRNKLGV